MSIINNIPAFNSQRQLGIINVNLARSIERLSTGLRINSARDDAAGLALSERLRAQIATLVQGTVNAQDSISVVQVAEGGLDTSTQILQRIKTLAATGASAAKSDSDRALLQVEADQLVDELARIADTTAFAGRTLLNGNIASAQNGQPGTASINGNAFIGAQSTALVAAVSVSTGIGAGQFSTQNATFQLKVVAGANTGAFTVQVFSSLSTAAEINAGTPLLEASIGGPIAFQLVTVPTGAVSGQGTISVILNSNGFSAATDAVGKVAFVSSTAASVTSTTDNSLLVQIGAGAGETIKVNAPNVRPNALFNNQAVRLDTFVQSEGLLNQVDQALDTLNRGRAQLGALQNRFENSIRNNDIFQENLRSSESRIRDLNVAAETTNFTKNQILLQSATAFLAQANLIPQSILQLLR